MIMSEHKKPRFNKNDSRKPQQAQTAPQPQIEELEEEVKWNPTPEVFEAFLTRDRKLAAGNIAMVLSGRGQGVTLRELKDSTLHSSECLEEVLTSGVAQGLIVENKGKFSLAPRTR